MIIITIHELDSKLKAVESDFANEIRSNYSNDFKSAPVTEGDISMLANRMHDALDDFRKLIVEYLKQ